MTATHELFAEVMAVQAPAPVVAEQLQQPLQPEQPQPADLDTLLRRHGIPKTVAGLALWQ